MDILWYGHNLLFKKPSSISYYNATLINSDGLEITIKLDGDAKCDLKKFESTINQATRDFNVTGIEEYSEFGSLIEPMSYDDLVECVNRNKT